MKNIYKLIILFLIAGFYTSCNEAIDIDQPGRFSADSAFGSVGDLQLGILSSYNRLDFSDDITFSATFTDEISIGFDNGGQGLGDGRYGFILNSTSVAPRQVWNDSYRVINSVNRILEAASTITPETDETDLFNSVRGQALAIRAFAHFQLWSYYTTDYTDGSSSSVIVVDFVPTIDQELGRNSSSEVLALINSDLDEAFGLLPEATDAPTFINKDFVTALRARLAAYTQDYAAAASNAQQLIDKYPLADQTQYFNMFDDIDNTEVIFKLERSVGDSYDNQGTGGGGWAGSLFAFVDATLTGSPYFEMSRSLFNLFEAGDVRLDRNIDPSSVIDPNYASNPNFKNDDILVIRKYPGSDGQPLMNDLKIFRSSEMVLIAAEAAAANGDLEGSATFLKSIRDARLGADTELRSFASTQDALGAIMDERRIELSFEGHRYRDLKRMGTRAGRSVDRDPLDCQVNGACTIANDDHRFSFPIPDVEINANTVIRDQQNPGY